MIQLCFLFLWLSFFSFVSTQSMVGYVNSEGGFCHINPANGALSNCFTIPNTQLLPTNSCLIYNNVLYVLSQNFSTASTPYTLLAINLPLRNLIWSAPVLPYGPPPFSTTFGLVGYSSPDASIIVMVWGGSSSVSSQYYMVSLQGNVTVLKRNTMSPASAGIFDSQLQRMWMLVPGYTTNMFYYNFRDETRYTLHNEFNIVTMVYNPYNHLFYGLAQAAQSVLLYSWAWDYPTSLTLLGYLPNVQVNPWGNTDLDPTGLVLTFVSKSNQIVSISVQDASLISMSNPLVYRFYAFAYM